MTTADMIEAYIKLRDHKKKCDEEYKKSMERVNSALNKLEVDLLQALDDDGTSSAKAKGVGTAYVRTVSNMTTEDREAFLKYCLSNRELDAMDIRPNKTIIKEKLAEGESVPGVKVTQTRVVGVRKGS